MENFGLVAFREVTMLHDEKVSAPLNKQRVATIIAHEIVHQWFGNLVTQKYLLISRKLKFNKQSLLLGYTELVVRFVVE